MCVRSKPIRIEKRTGPTTLDGRWEIDNRQGKCLFTTNNQRNVQGCGMWTSISTQMIWIVPTYMCSVFRYPSRSMKVIIFAKHCLGLYRCSASCHLSHFEKNESTGFKVRYIWMVRKRFKCAWMIHFSVVDVIALTKNHCLERTFP